MAERQDNGRNPSGKSLYDILDFVTAGLAVVPRPDIEAVELRVRAAGHPDTKIVLAPVQAVTVAQKLIQAVLAGAAEAIQ
jgi:hypothetical protein